MTALIRRDDFVPSGVLSSRVNSCPSRISLRGIYVTDFIGGHVLCAHADGSLLVFSGLRLLGQ